MTLTGNTLAVTLYINNKIIYSEKFIEAISSFWIRYSSFFFNSSFVYSLYVSRCADDGEIRLSRVWLYK